MDKWDERTIGNALRKMVNATGQTTMPTHTEMHSFYGNYSLSNAIRRNGGTHYWASKLGLDTKNCESKVGEAFEERFKSDLFAHTMLLSESMPIRYPYDVLVEGAVKVDVKASHLYRKDGFGFYSCNLGKTYQTCDIFVVYCLKDDGEIDRVYIIPSSRLNGQKQLTIGQHNSKYDAYIEKWDIIEHYDRLMNWDYEVTDNKLT